MQKLGIPSVGIEANSMPCFATRVKVDWQADPDTLLKHAKEIAATACKRLALNGLEEYQNLPLFRVGKDKINPLGLRRLPLTRKNHCLAIQPALKRKGGEA